MRTSQLAVAVVAAFQFGCSHTPAPARVATPPSPVLTFLVAGSGGPALGGVTVSVLTATGQEIYLGKTDAFGTITIEKQMLRERRAAVLLFEHKWYFTAAIRVNEDLLRYGEQLVALAPFAIR